MNISKIGLSDGVWGIAVRPEGAIEQTLKTKRMPDDFHKAFYDLALSVGRYIGDENGVNRLNSISLSYKKEGEYLGVWFQKSFNGVSGFVKIDNIQLRKREDGEVEQLLKNIDIEEDEERKNAERNIYNRALAVNMLCDGLAQLKEVLENKWDNLLKQGDDQLAFDFGGLEADKEVTKKRVLEFSKNEEVENGGKKKKKKESV